LLVLPRSRPVLTVPTSTGKSLSSFYASHYRFVLCQTGGFVENQSFRLRSIA
jgi:hypothetical protein